MRLTTKFTSPEDTGYSIFGPIFLYFCNSLYKKIRNEKIDKLFFLSREGFFLKKIFDLFLSVGGLKDSLGENIENEYMLCSRRAVFGAMVKDESVLREIFSYQYFNGSIRDLLQARIGVEIDDEIMSKFVSLPGDIEKLIEILTPYLSLMNRSAESERYALLKYLDSIGYLGAHNPCLVDIGYSATTQNKLFGITDKNIQGFYFVTRDSVKAWENDANRAEGCFASYLDDDMSVPVYDFCQFLEAFLIAEDGQLNYFKEQNDSISPVYGPKSLTHHNWETVLQVITGIESYIADYFHAGFSPDSICAEDSQLLFLSAVENDLWDDDIRKIFFLEDKFCGNREFNILEFHSSSRRS